ncbi:hypothetical protein [Maribacter sp. 2308TA10-17]|uniref:hypothetical protein n=1 Tax=Maribacter sp. 2308TA10-17 TaxID=3386276 RepID=UPI0039BD7CA2
MANRFKTIFASFGIAFILIVFEYFLESSFLSLFLKENLVGLLLTLMAINTATSTVISGKLEEISERTGADFADVIKEIKFSLVEQIALIIMAVILLIIEDSKVLETKVEYFDTLINILLATILVYAVDILRDTGVAIFNIVIELSKKND